MRRTLSSQRSSSSRIATRDSATRASSRGSTSGSTTGARAQGVVELQLEAEAAERSWECEHKKDVEAQCGGPDCQRACAVVDRHFVSFKIRGV